ncbi:MAG: MaoC/PaaZ C-terminal domain-containing protein [Maritimibacter sp.]
MKQMYFDDVEVGFTYATATKKITREAVIGFAQEWDPQPFHLDDEAAAKTHFGRIAASGWHTLLIAFNLGLETGVWRESSLGAAGMDEVRWLTPVYPDDVIYAQSEVVWTERSKTRPDRGRVRINTQVLRESDGDDEVVARFVSRILLRCRP